MKNNRLILLFFIFCFYWQDATAAKLEIKYFELPLLSGKTGNPAIRIKLEVGQDDLGKLFNGLKLSFNGSTDLDDITGVQLFTTESDSSLKPKLQGLSPLSEHTGAASQVQLRINHKIEQTGSYYFWVCLGVKENADLMHKISVQLESAYISDQIISGNYAPKHVYRLGYALREHKQDNVHTSRIPGLATSNKGTLLAIYDARYESARDLQGHMDIAVQRSTDHGETWQPIKIALDMGKWGDLPEKFNGVSDAAILVDKKTGTIYIAGLWSYGVINDDGQWVQGLSDTSTNWNHQWRTRGSQAGFDVKQTSQFLITKSTDDGLSWSEPVNITRQGKKEEWWLWAPAPGQGITMKDGTLVFPTQGRDKHGIPFSNITFSKDQGKTWHSSKAATHLEKGTTECAVVELQDGVLMLNMRANRNRGLAEPNNGRAIAITKDLGKTWQQHSTSLNTLIEPTCMASLHKHEFIQGQSTQEILFFSNPHSVRSRDHMTVQASFNLGQTWPKFSHILLDEWSSRGYSCITSVDQQTIGILYESSQADMVFQKIPIQEFLGE